MTIWPGDELTGGNGHTFQVERLVAYQGKDGCTDPRCTRVGGGPRDDGTWEMGECRGWHCSRCDAACSSQGHNCPLAPREEQQ